MTAEAKARFKEGLDLYKAHKNVEARAKYLQALALSQAAAVYLNLAVVEYDLMLYPDALRHAKAYVLHPKAEPAKVDKLKKEMIPDLESKTAHLSVEGQPGQPVFVDGEKVGVAPIADQVHVAPGEHTVACGSITKTVVVKAGDTTTVIVVINTPPTPSASTSPPPSATPAASTAPPPSASTAPVPSASATVEPPKEGHRSTVGWVVPISLVALGAGGIVGGVVFNSAANGKHDDGIKARGGQNCTGNTSPGCQQAAQDASDEQSDKNLSTAMFITGGAFVVGGVVAFLLWPKDTATPQSSYLVPSVGKSGVGLIYGTSF